MITICDICKSTPCKTRCPNYKTMKTNYYCSICEEGIQNGEEYLVNDSGKHAHWECFSVIGSRELVKWLELNIQVMEDE